MAKNVWNYVNVKKWTENVIHSECMTCKLHHGKRTSGPIWDGQSNNKNKQISNFVSFKIGVIEFSAKVILKLMSGLRKSII